MHFLLYTTNLNKKKPPKEAFSYTIQLVTPSVVPIAVRMAITV